MRRHQLVQLQLPAEQRTDGPGAHIPGVPHAAAVAVSGPYCLRLCSRTHTSIHSSLIVVTP
jgi:hypothetical protein